MVLLFVMLMMHNMPTMHRVLMTNRITSNRPRTTGVHHVGALASPILRDVDVEDDKHTHCCTPLLLRVTDTYPTDGNAQLQNSKRCVSIEVAGSGNMIYTFDAYSSINNSNRYIYIQQFPFFSQTHRPRTQKRIKKVEKRLLLLRRRRRRLPYL